MKLISDETLDKAALTLTEALCHENSVAYEFANNDYNSCRGVADDDPYYAKLALELRDDVDKIVARHKAMQELVKRVVNQAKFANNLQQPDVGGSE